MRLYLVQHALCLDKSIDPERSLSAEGRETAVKMAKTAAKHGIKISTVYHSGKKRALQTAEILSEYLQIDAITQADGLSPLDDVQAFSDQFQFTDNAMIIGHLPFLQRLSSYLICGQPEPAIVKFQNAGIICLQQDENNHWYLNWTLLPQID